MPPQQPQNPQDPNQPQPIQPQPVVSQAPSFQQPVPSTGPYTAPSNWNTLFILALVFDVIMPIVGLILGEVLYRKAKAAGDDAWRKKARGAIALGCLVMIVAFMFYFLTAFNKAKNDTTQSSDAFWSQAEKDHEAADANKPSDSEVTLRAASIDLGLSDYYSNQNPSQQPNYVLSYPTLSQLNDSSWRQTNHVDFSKGELPDSIIKSITFVSGTPTSYSQFGYIPTPTGCQNTQASPCTGYKLLAKKQNGIYTENN